MMILRQPRTPRSSRIASGQLQRISFPEEAKKSSCDTAVDIAMCIEVTSRKEEDRNEKLISADVFITIGFYCADSESLLQQ
jgi:hypothetical protein